MDEECEFAPRAQIVLPMVAGAPERARDFLRSQTCPVHNSWVEDDAVWGTMYAFVGGMWSESGPVMLMARCNGESMEALLSDPRGPVPSQRRSAEPGRGRKPVLRDFIEPEWVQDGPAFRWSTPRRATVG